MNKLIEVEVIKKFHSQEDLDCLDNSVHREVLETHPDFQKNVPTGSLSSDFFTNKHANLDFCDLGDPKFSHNLDSLCQSSKEPVADLRSNKTLDHISTRVKSQPAGRIYKISKSGKALVLRTLFSSKLCTIQTNIVPLFDSHIHLNSHFRLLAQKNLNPICTFCRFQYNAHNFKRPIKSKRYKKNLKNTVPTIKFDSLRFFAFKNDLFSPLFLPFKKGLPTSCP